MDAQPSRFPLDLILPTGPIRVTRAGVDALVFHKLITVANELVRDGSDIPFAPLANADEASDAEIIAHIEPVLAGPSAAEQLATAKTALKARATERRWEVEVGGIDVGGMSVTTDDRSKTLLMQADRGARLHDLGARWKNTEGVWISLSAEQVKGLALAVDTHVRACFAREEELHSLIDCAADMAALNALKPTVETFTA